MSIVLDSSSFWASVAPFCHTARNSVFLRQRCALSFFEQPSTGRTHTASGDDDCIGLAWRCHLGPLPSPWSRCFKTKLHDVELLKTCWTSSCTTSCTTSQLARQDVVNRCTTNKLKQMDFGPNQTPTANPQRVVATGQSPKIKNLYNKSTTCHDLLSHKTTRQQIKVVGFGLYVATTEWAKNLTCLNVDNFATVTRTKACQMSEVSECCREKGPCLRSRLFKYSLPNFSKFGPLALPPSGWSNKLLYSGKANKKHTT